jgi:DNA-binding MarR family transcriptional regulator
MNEYDEVAQLQVAVMRLARTMRTHSTSGLTPTQMSALGVVFRDGPLTLGQLAHAEHVRAPSISRTVDSLVNEGLVERTPNPEDARAVLVSITDAGVKFVKDVRKARRSWLASRWLELSADDRHQLTRAAPILLRLAQP